MKTSLIAGSLIVSIAASLAAAKAPEANSGQREMAKLQGSWRPVRLQIGGKAVDPDFLTRKGGGISLDVMNDHYHFVGMGADFRGSVRVEMRAKAKRLVFTRDDGTATYSAYEWESDDLLKLAGMMAEQTVEDPNTAEVWVLKREKLSNGHRD